MHEPAAAAVPHGPILEWFDQVFHTTNHQVPARHLTPDFPTAAMGMQELHQHLHIYTKLNPQGADNAWAAVVRLTRQPGREGTLWRFIAIGLALWSLRHAARRIGATNADERAELHADLVQGFLQRLPTIDIDRPNIAARLVDSARHHARRHRHHHDPRPYNNLDLLPTPTTTGWQDTLDRLAADMAAAGRRLHPTDLEIIARTRIDGLPLRHVAADLHLPAETAYKRRLRAEERLAAFHRIRQLPPATAPKIPDDATPSA